MYPGPGNHASSSIRLPGTLEPNAETTIYPLIQTESNTYLHPGNIISSPKRKSCVTLSPPNYENLFGQRSHHSSHQPNQGNPLPALSEGPFLEAGRRRLPQRHGPGFHPIPCHLFRNSETTQPSERSSGPCHGLCWSIRLGHHAPLLLSRIKIAVRSLRYHRGEEPDGRSSLETIRLAHLALARL